MPVSAPRCVHVFQRYARPHSKRKVTGYLADIHKIVASSYARYVEPLQHRDALAANKTGYDAIRASRS
jgi:hypothetical protein